jgi:hypothetical protein
VRRRSRVGPESDPNQFQIDWTSSGVSPRSTSSAVADPSAAPPLPASVLNLRLKWDFAEFFPEPTEQAIEAGHISPEEITLENVRAIHEAHAREMLAALHDLDAVYDAKRRGVDPATGKPPRTEASRERLQKAYETEPLRLERWFENLLGVYSDTFGQEAAEAFGKAVRAWHAGFKVTLISEPAKMPPALAAPAVSSTARATPRPERTRIPARLPVPRPLPAAIAAAQFGRGENGKPVRPGTHEVRAIIRNHADKLIDLLDLLASAPLDAKDELRAKFTAGITAYGEDFGEHEAKQLEAYVRRQASLDDASRHER